MKSATGPGRRIGTLLTVAVVIIAGCSAGSGSGAGATAALDVVVNQEMEVNGLLVNLDRVVVESDRVQVGMTLHNPGDQPISLLLGGCGPSQGRVSTATEWRELYYQAQPDGDLGGTVAPGGSRSAVITLLIKAGEPLDPRAVTELQLHPGYVLHAGTGQLELLQITLPLKEGGAS